MRFAEPEGVFVVQIGRFRGQIDVEDTAFWVTAYDAETGEVDLTDGSSEPLRSETLQTDEDGVLRCTVKGRFPARFTRAGQAHLLDHVEFRASGLVLRVAGRWLDASRLLPYKLGQGAVAKW